MERPEDFDNQLDSLTAALVDSYKSDSRTHYLNRSHLPSCSEAIEILEIMLAILYPGYHGRGDLTFANISYHTGELLTQLADKLYPQIHLCLAYQRELNANSPQDSNCQKQAAQKTVEFLRRIPTLRDALAGHVQAAYDGDPAAVNTDETILAYPGLLAITIYRIAHQLTSLDVPLLPRIMTARAHSVTGVDIHPGATIGRNFFIDHATGVVIGQTTVIGDNVKIYQGVTLGALSFPKDQRGRLIRDQKRHPTIEDDVTIYASATILGGATVIGKGCVIGANVFITSSVKPGQKIGARLPKLHFGPSGST